MGPLGHAAERNTRTCMSCGAAVAKSELLRFVSDLEEHGVVFDLTAKAPGRGSYVHANESCLKRLGTKLPAMKPPSAKARPELVATSLLLAVDRRLTGLVLTAFRLGQVAIGRDAAREAQSHPDAVTVVACDAMSASSGDEFASRAQPGSLLVWNTREGLGKLLGRSEVAVCVIRHPEVAREMVKARAIGGAAEVVLERSGRSDGRPGVESEDR